MKPNSPTTPIVLVEKLPDYPRLLLWPSARKVVEEIETHGLTVTSVKGGSSVLFIVRRRNELVLRATPADGLQAFLAGIRAVTAKDV